ncbi:hypothetical protein TGMAS_206500A [Toxoplasma gondii MAS]|uniref:Uncharacterized protein n=1 Tax=Toxoplasma gondii MAS TaxID=943118 RepID=A0A086Q6C8_TOXGO|nr:hypothetical protein TGMAS_206500A [Toxoplasma gondii MAS]
MQPQIEEPQKPRRKRACAFSDHPFPLRLGLGSLVCSSDRRLLQIFLGVSWLDSPSRAAASQASRPPRRLSAELLSPSFFQSEKAWNLCWCESFAPLRVSATSAEAATPLRGSCPVQTREKAPSAAKNSTRLQRKNGPSDCKASRAASSSTTRTGSSPLVSVRIAESPKRSGSDSLTRVPAPRSSDSRTPSQKSSGKR